MLSTTGKIPSNTIPVVLASTRYLAMSLRGAPAWFAATAGCVLVGVVISAVTAANNTGGHFHPALARAANAFAFFTIQSNLLVGIVFHAVLAQSLDLKSWDAVGNELVHTVVPVMALVGWLLAGPRGVVSPRLAWLSLIFPACWLGFTLTRGALADWYPYPFVDVTQLGYGRTAVNCVWVAVLFLGLAAGATILDGQLRPGVRQS
jgi:hypothetical protein